jgi:hypothetical protein
MDGKTLYTKTLIAALLLFTACSQSKEIVQDMKESMQSLFGYAHTDSIICKTSPHINNSFADYLKTRADKELLTRIAVVDFNVPENFTGVATVRKDYGSNIANRFKERLIKYSPSGIFELLSVENLSVAERRRDFERGSHRAIVLAKSLGYNTLVVGQLHDITNDSDITVILKIIDLESRITLWSGEVLVQVTERNPSNKNVSKNNQSVFYFDERITVAAECAVKNIINPEL